CADLLDEQALVGLAGDDGRPRLAAAEHRRPGAQVEAALPPPGAVTDGAAAQQDGQDVVLRQGGVLPLACAGAALDPPADGRDLVLAETVLPGGGHLAAVDLLVQEALVRRAGDDRRPALAAPQGAG